MSLESLGCIAHASGEAFGNVLFNGFQFAIPETSSATEEKKIPHDPSISVNLKKRIIPATLSHLIPSCRWAALIVEDPPTEEKDLSDFATQLRNDLKSDPSFPVYAWNPRDPKLQQYSKEEVTALIQTFESEFEKQSQRHLLYYIDLNTGDVYTYGDTPFIRFKCLLLFIATPLQACGLLLNAANRIIKLVSLMHLWIPTDQPVSFRARIVEMGKDLLRIFSTIFFLIGLTFFALYGVFGPRNGAKGYATIERMAYAGAYRGPPCQRGLNLLTEEKTKQVQRVFLAPCIQPNPDTHLLSTSPTYCHRSAGSQFAVTV